MSLCYSSPQQTKKTGDVKKAKEELVSVVTKMEASLPGPMAASVVLDTVDSQWADFSTAA